MKWNNFSEAAMGKAHTLEQKLFVREVIGELERVWGRRMTLAKMSSGENLEEFLCVLEAGCRTLGTLSWHYSIMEVLVWASDLSPASFLCFGYVGRPHRRTYGRLVLKDL